MQRSRHRYTPGLLSRLSGVPKTTIVNWTTGRVSRPRHWRDLAAVAEALQLSESELDRLLAAAGYPPVATLLALASDPVEQQLLRFWRHEPSAKGPALVAVSEPPPVQSARRPALESRPAHNLPAALTSFVGREAERAYIRSLLAQPDCRLLTLSGPGGIGKTRLASEIARGFLGPATPYPDGIYLVSLASLRLSEHKLSDSSPLAGAIAASIGLPLSGATPPAEQLLQALQNKAMLLVIDNFEHLLPMAGLLSDMLAYAPGIKLVVTSREILKLYGEWIYELEGLATPPGEAPLATGYASVELFAQRARQRDQGFDLADALPHVAHICRVLAGNPLSIELAAAWVRLLGCKRLAREIDTSLDILTTQSPNVPERHRSLRATFEHSWRLLDPLERASFARLTVFSGGFTAAAALAVASVPLTMLERLSDVSLIQRGGADRFMLHELLRQFGAEHLPEGDVIGARHMRYFADLAEQHEPALSLGEPEAGAIVEADLGNLRAAWRMAVALPDAAAIGQLLDALATLDELRGRLLEGRDGLELALRALLHEPSLDELLLGRIELRLARLCEQLAQYETAQAYATASIARFERVGAADRAAMAGVTLGSILHAIGDNRGAVRLLEQSLQVFRALGHRRGQEEALYALCFPYDWLEDGQVDVLELAEESMALAQQLGDLRGLARCRYFLGNACIGAGEYQRALEHYAESQELSQMIGDTVGVANCLKNRGMAAQTLGQFDAAEESMQAAMAIFARIGDQRGLANSLYNLGTVAEDRGRHREAQDYLQRSLGLYRRLGRAVAEAVVLGALSRVVLALGDERQAMAQVRQALTITLEARSDKALVSAFPALAMLLLRKGEVSLAVTTLAHTAQNPTAEARLWAWARAELEQAAEQLPPATFAACVEQGQARSAAQVAAAGLAALPA